MSRLSVDRHRQLIATESARLSAISADDLNRQVDHLEGWTVHSLVGHTAWVCRFAARCLTADPSSPPARSSVGDPPAGAAVLDWYAEGVEELSAALDGADVGRERPTWTGPQPAAWWFRRLSHELAIHRWDAFTAAGREVHAVDAEQALDGIDEVLDVFTPRRMQFDTLAGDGETIHLHTTDVDDGEWMLTLRPEAVEWEPGHAKGDVAARGAASDLLLLLWSRIGPERVEVFGDESLLHRWQSAAAF
ncbi:MAG: maleylpyruvate isomerase family mycothiol-dependent enzyme [Actinomycetota bacterium]